MTKADPPLIIAGNPDSKLITPEFITTRNGQIKLNRIPAGKFMMGSPDGEGPGREHPRHEVRITRPFYLGAFELTQAQYKAVTGQNPSDNKGGDILPPDNLPVERVFWLDAVRFCNTLSEKEALEPFYAIVGAMCGPWIGAGGAIACQLRRNGSTPAGPEPIRGIPLATTRRTCAIMHGISRTPTT